MKTQEKLNMTMLCDFYELTMGNGYFEAARCPMAAASPSRQVWSS